MHHVYSLTTNQHEQEMKFLVTKRLDYFYSMPYIIIIWIARELALRERFTLFGLCALNNPEL